MQQQIDFLTTSLQDLKKQVENLPITPDDGTAAALVGTWNGTASSIQFGRAASTTSGSLQFEPFSFQAPAGGHQGPTAFFSVVQPQNLQPMTVGVNPEMWLARSGTPNTIVFTITRDGMKLSGMGTSSEPNQSIQNFTFTGIVLSNNFFLLRVLVAASGPCASSTGRVVFQGTGSLSGDRTGMSFTGSAINQDCKHSVFRVGLTKQQ